ncbi:MAG TPA: diguanylate cyclase [Alphaproteobacteria bacterium]|nr:diguanylate cyclase [Alphaproteobacteria bacterium]
MPKRPTDTTPSPAILLARVIDDYVGWLGQWHRWVFYPEAAGPEPGRLRPGSFAAWQDALDAKELDAQPAVLQVLAEHAEMHALAETLLAEARRGRAPDATDHREMVAAWETFIAHLRRIERAFNVAASGIDPLTGLRTRLGMFDELQKELARLERGGSAFCIAICDVDRFKSINDRWGHDVGDRVLAATAAMLGRHTRPFDDAYRMGGEEFLLCLKRAPLADALTVLERLRLALAAAPIDTGEGEALHVTASFGVVEVRPGADIDELVIRADKALYAAKNGGRNRVCVAEWDALDETAAAAADDEGALPRGFFGRD